MACNLHSADRPFSLSRTPMRHDSTSEKDTFFRFHVMESFCYDADADYLYLNNAKSGCSTIRGTLIESMSAARRESVTSTGGGNIHGNGWWDWNLQRIAEHRPYTFTVVRNPFTRVLSAWLDKIRGETLQRQQFCHAYGLPVDADISFLDFLRALDPDATVMDKHWRSQAQNVYAHSLDIDSVYHLENFDANAATLAERLELDSGFTTRKPHATGASRKVREFYCDESVELVQTLYAEDFRLFGYSPDIADVDDAPAAPTETRNGGEATCRILSLIGLSLSAHDGEEDVGRFAATMAGSEHPPSVYEQAILARVPGYFDEAGQAGVEAALVASLGTDPTAGERLAILDFLVATAFGDRDPERAIAHLDTLCGLAPYVVRFHVRRVEALLAAGRVPDAIERLEQLRSQTWQKGVLAELDDKVREVRARAA